jgi:TM2 domain-containing membrane protein YozV
VVAPKSAGVAILLTFLWLGAGHLYLNRVGHGVALLVLHFFLALLCLTGVGALLGVPGWILGFVLAAVSCSSIAAQDNARPVPPPQRPW